MLTQDRMPTLSRILAVRSTWVAAAVTLLLVVFFFAKYMLDTPNLRRATLEDEISTILASLRNGEDPSRLYEFRHYPGAYGFRVFDRRLPQTRRLIATANPELFPSLAQLTDEANRNGEPEITEGFGRLPGPHGQPAADRWVMTDHEDVKNRSYWLQVVMIGDPDWRWRSVMAGEMLDHVVVPVLSVVPPLVLAILLAMRYALRPLDRIARQAAALGVAAGSGGQLSPLATERLPVEFYQVVSAINAMLARLQQTLSLQKQFTADAAHELRTPLAVLLLQINELPPGPAVETIREELRGLGMLVNQLLQFAQAEDAVAQQHEPVDIGAVARKVCEDLAGTALARRQEIEFDAPGHLRPVPGHAALIETAVRNVVDNAINYAPAGTTISVSVEPDSRVIVEDRGPGVPHEQRELIFNRFWRADRRRSAGAGIGLALVRRIAQLHGGNASVEDRDGGGARFVLTFAASGRD
ncbi:MAG: HAMP domain-containing sensor histidine kinase [Rhodopila sp.]|nr:HAMP domain-containing sensor histidine kinase [Rhodopila sp.]